MKEIKTGNGGAGIVGFVEYMYTKFNEIYGTDYNFVWIKSDTEETINGMINATLDIGWPYGIDRVCNAYNKNKNNWIEPIYIFRDHFILVGPKTNSASLPIVGGDHPHISNNEVYDIFKTISKGQNGTKFFTRNDKSATNILEREIFKCAIGRYPDVDNDKEWYVQIKDEHIYPQTALEISNKNDYYTLSDRGIWTWATPEIKSNLRIFCEGGDENPNDILLNPCLAVVRNDSPQEALEFFNWLKEEGQNFIEEYKQYGENLYSKAPGDNFYPCKGK